VVNAMGKLRPAKSDEEGDAHPEQIMRSVSAPPHKPPEKVNLARNKSGFVDESLGSSRSSAAIGSDGIFAMDMENSGVMKAAQMKAKEQQEYGESRAQADFAYFQQQQYMYGYPPSPALHASNIGLVAMTPPSPGLYPYNATAAAATSPYMGPASLSPYPTTPDFHSQQRAVYDYQQQQMAHSPSPHASPYLHALLPQSLLSTPPTPAMQINSQPRGGSSPGTGANQFQSGYASAAMEQQRQQMYAAAAQSSPGYGPSAASYMYGYPMTTQGQPFYSSNGMVYPQTSPGMVSVPMMPQPMNGMPSMQQLPPSARASTPGQQSTRVLSSVSDTNLNVKGRSSPSSMVPPAAPRNNTTANGSTHGSPRSSISSPRGALKGWGETEKLSARPSKLDAVDSQTTPSHETQDSLTRKLEELRASSPTGNGPGGRGRGERNGRNPGSTRSSGQRGGSFFNDANQKRGSGGGSHKSSPSINASHSANRVPWGLKEIKGQLVEFAKDQHGSRFIQNQLESSGVDSADKDAVFEEILPNATELCADVFGNYVVQKLLSDVCTEEQKERLVDKAIKGHMLEHSNHMYSCRVIQKMVECVFKVGDVKPGPDEPGGMLYSMEYQDELLCELEGEVLRCVRDANANHVIQKLLESVRPLLRIDFVFDAVKGSVVELSKHQFGCRVAQRAMENADEERLKFFLEELMQDVENLVRDNFGNYVIQHIIANGSKHPKDSVVNITRARLVRIVTDNLLAFSQQKFSSNVVEKCMETGSQSERRAIIAKMLNDSGSPRGTTLEQMMKDPYANYVLQSALKLAQPDQRKEIVKIIEENASTLKRLTYGRHILNRLEQEKNGGPPNGSNNHGGKKSRGKF